MDLVVTIEERAKLGCPHTLTYTFGSSEVSMLDVHVPSKNPSDRRIETRAHVAMPIWLNKYIEGFPYVAELVDISADGMRIRTTLEPNVDVDSFSVELGVPGMSNRIWLWAKRVRREGKYEALKLMGTELFDRAYLTQLTRWHAQR